MFIWVVFNTHGVIDILVLRLRTNGWGIWVVRLGMRARNARPYGDGLEDVGGIRRSQFTRCNQG
jgi:hypothetical protein